ncbi:MAG: hypothetical protein IH946_02855, partial [Bacteroidetes bacterium]|nr:hypothetical protein [Bacteroidota bacterium]
MRIVYLSFLLSFLFFSFNSCKKSSVYSIDDVLKVTNELEYTESGDTSTVVCEAVDIYQHELISPYKENKTMIIQQKISKVTVYFNGVEKGANSVIDDVEITFGDAGSNFG